MTFIGRVLTFNWYITHPWSVFFIWMFIVVVGLNILDGIGVFEKADAVSQQEVHRPNEKEMDVLWEQKRTIEEIAKRYNKDATVRIPAAKHGPHVVECVE